MTQPVVVTIPHEIGVAEARRRLDQGFDRIEREIASGMARVKKTWDGDRMTFTAEVLGQAIVGRMDVFERSIRLEVDLPPILAMVANTIKGRLKKQTTLLLTKK